MAGEPVTVPESVRVAPASERGRERLDSIIRAAREHYDEVGRDTFSMKGVADQSGCSIGTVYRYFEDRQALLDVIRPGRDLQGQALDRIRLLIEAPKESITDFEKTNKRILNLIRAVS